jgi:hypothetical protein
VPDTCPFLAFELNNANETGHAVSTCHDTNSVAGPSNSSACYDNDETNQVTYKSSNEDSGQAPDQTAEALN